MAKKKNMFGTSEDVGALSSKDLANISQINQPTTTNGLAPITGITNINQPKTTQTPNEQPSPNQVFRNETGKPSGITVGGKTFLGLNPRDVESIAAAEQAKKGGVATQAFEQKALLQRQQLEQQQSLNEIQNKATSEPIISEADILNAVPQQPGLETLQTGGAAIGGAISGGLGGAVLGAKAGALFGTAAGPVGTLVGAGLGALVGLVGASYAKITIEKRGDVRQAAKVAKIANTNFGQTIDALNAGLISRETALQRWNNDKISLYSARINLKRDTMNDLNKFLSDGADELAIVEDYIKDLETIYTTEFLLAYSAPDPTRIKYIINNDVTAE